MKIVESRPITTEFKLKTDPDEEATVTLRQLTFDEVKRRDDYINSKRKTVYLETGGSAVEDLNVPDLFAHDIYWGLIAVSGIVDEKNQPLFQFKDDTNGLQKLAYSFGEFMKLLGKLPPETVYEMHDCFLEVNPVFVSQRGKPVKVEPETGE